jgi:2,4-dienoyl-CoA reductase (NADPH2)
MGYPEQIQYPEPQVPLAKKIRRVKYLAPLMKEIKSQVNIPLVAIGRLDAELGEWLLHHGVADLIAFNRRFYADPDYVNKIAAGRFDEIAPYTACMHCWASQQTGRHIQCRINASLAREQQMEIKPAAQKKKVLIIGGGPAGMEAARVSALRGHDVTLYEKNNMLGGLIPLAAMIKGTEIEDLPLFITYFRKQLRKLGVQVKLNAEVNPDIISQLKPDVILIASGARLTQPQIPGIDKRIVVSNAALHKQSKLFMKYFGPNILRWLTNFYMPFGRNVVIIGGLMQGCELADFLIKRGRKVTMVESTDQIGTGIHEINRSRLVPWLEKRGVVMLTGVTYKEVTDKGLIINTREGEEKLIEADSVLTATPAAPDTMLYDMFKDKAKEVYQIGDCRDPRMIIDAVSDGSKIARAI